MFCHFMVLYITKLVVNSPVARGGHEVFLMASGGEGEAFLWCTQGGNLFFRHRTSFL